jgi:hypothetical protein
MLLKALEKELMDKNPYLINVMEQGIDRNYIISIIENHSLKLPEEVLSDSLASLPGNFGQTGETVDKMNGIRRELNANGFNLGERMSYQALSAAPGTSSYLPFDNSSLTDLQNGTFPPSASSKFLKF